MSFYVLCWKYLLCIGWFITLFSLILSDWPWISLLLSLSFFSNIILIVSTDTLRYVISFSFDCCIVNPSSFFLGISFRGRHVVTQVLRTWAVIWLLYLCISLLLRKWYEKKKKSFEEQIVHLMKWNKKCQEFLSWLPERCRKRQSDWRKRFISSVRVMKIYVVITFLMIT